VTTRRNEFTGLSRFEIEHLAFSLKQSCRIIMACRQSPLRFIILQRVLRLIPSLFAVWL
jgi:hypothetical protein